MRGAPLDRLRTIRHFPMEKGMPAIIIGTQMEKGPSTWRHGVPFPEEGPADGLLVIEFHGDPWAIPGFKGDVLDIAELRAACPLAATHWIPLQGNLKCKAQLAVPARLSISLSQTMSAHRYQPPADTRA
jgi:hypothetical protein